MLSTPTTTPASVFRPAAMVGVRAGAGPAAKRLIVNADDLGLSRGVTDGILDAHRDGIVTSASFMVNQPASEYAVARLKEFPRLDAGIHLNLCQNQPVLPAEEIPSLVGNDGCFLRPAEMARKLMLWRASTREIEKEFCAQIDRMRAYGLEPSHADSHHRFHLYPAAVPAFNRAVHSRGITKARAPRKEIWPSDHGFGGAHAGPLLRRMAIDLYNTVLQTVVFSSLKLPDAGVALHPQLRKHLALLTDAWVSVLEHMTAGTYEIWCHPGRREAGFSETDGLAERRELEVAMLTHARVKEAIGRSGIQLISFRDL